MVHAVTIEMCRCLGRCRHYGMDTWEVVTNAHVLVSVYFILRMSIHWLPTACAYYGVDEVTHSGATKQSNY